MVWELIVASPGIKVAFPRPHDWRKAVVNSNPGPADLRTSVVSGHDAA